VWAGGGFLLSLKSKGLIMKILTIMKQLGLLAKGAVSDLLWEPSIKREHQCSQQLLFF
jgi:hypothetical protein